MTYSTIVADPPWRVKAGPGAGDYTLNESGKQIWNPASGPTRDLAFASMSIEQIKAMEIPAAPNAHLYLWTINAYVEHAYDVARAWGFKPSTLLVWAKNPFGGGLGGAWGISTEYILFARRGKLASTGRITGTWFNWKRPYDERGKPRHSGKPEAFQDLVETVSPGPYLEMFARRHRPGWTCVGDEL